MIDLYDKLGHLLQLLCRWEMARQPGESGRKQIVVVLKTPGAGIMENLASRTLPLLVYASGRSWLAAVKARGIQTHSSDARSFASFRLARVTKPESLLLAVNDFANETNCRGHAAFAAKFWFWQRILSIGGHGIPDEVKLDPTLG